LWKSHDLDLTRRRGESRTNGRKKKKNRSTIKKGGTEGGGEHEDAIGSQRVGTRKTGAPKVSNLGRGKPKVQQRYLRGGEHANRKFGESLQKGNSSVNEGWQQKQWGAGEGGGGGWVMKGRKKKS